MLVLANIYIYIYIYIWGIPIQTRSYFILKNVSSTYPDSGGGFLACSLPSNIVKTKKAQKSVQKSHKKHNEPWKLLFLTLFLVCIILFATQDLCNSFFCNSKLLQLKTCATQHFCNSKQFRTS